MQNVQAVTAMFNLDTDIWVGTSTGSMFVIDKQVIYLMPIALIHVLILCLKSLEVIDTVCLPQDDKSRSRKMTILSGGPHCVWVASGASIHIISNKVMYGFVYYTH